MAPAPRNAARQVVLLLGIGFLASFPAYGNAFYVDLALRLMLLGMLAMALDLALGYAGLISLGHAAFFGAGGYVLAWMTPDSGPANLWLVAPMALTASALLAAMFGWIAARAAGAAFLMITLALGQVAYYATLEIPGFGGADGHLIAFAPVLPLGPIRVNLGSSFTLYYFSLVTLVLLYVCLRLLVHGPLGRALQAGRDNEPRLRALGVNTALNKVVVMAISGGIAGLAGLLSAIHDGFVSPEHLAWHASGQALVTVIIGGAGTLFGPIFGTFAFGILQDILQDLTSHWKLALGAIIIAAMIGMPGGLASLLNKRWLKERRRT